MQDNRISIDVTADLISKAVEDVSKVRDILQPFLQGLSKTQRQRLAKMSKKTLAFVRDTSSFTKTHPEFAPVFLDIPEMDKDLAAYEVLKPLYDVLNSFFSDLQDTMMLCGSEAFAGARYYYNSVSYAAKQGNLAAKPIADDLALRFAKERKSAKK